MSQRLQSLDNLRTFAGILRCFIHSAIPYMFSRSGVSLIHENNGIKIFDYLVFVSHSFIEELFYFIAGYVAFIQLSKIGERAFAKNKVWRIIFPFLISMLILIPIVIVCFQYVQLKKPGLMTINLFSLFINSYILLPKNYFPLLHLWFLYYLILFNYFILLVLWVVAKFNLNQLIEKIKKIIYVKPSYFLLLLIIPFICLLVMKKWFVMSPFNMIPDLPFFIYFFIYFLMGIIAAQNSWLILKCTLHMKKLFLGGIIFSLIAAYLQQFYLMNNYPYYILILYLAKTTTYITTLCLWSGMIGFSFSQWNRKIPVLHEFKSANYFSYLVHLPIVVIAQLLMYYYLPVPVIVKFLLAFTICLIIPYVLYKYIIPQRILKWIN